MKGPNKLTEKPYLLKKEFKVNAQHVLRLERGLPI